MELYLEKAEKHKKDCLFRLLQYSLYEESLTDGNDLNEEALYAYPWFESYFTKEAEVRDAYFIKQQETGRLLGFAMVNAFVQKYSFGHSIAEFMVLPKYRRKQIGKKAAVLCFDRYPGPWEVSPSYGSKKAYQFWKAVIGAYTAQNYRYEDGIFCFTKQTAMETPMQKDRNQHREAAGKLCPGICSI